MLMDRITGLSLLQQRILATLFSLVSIAVVIFTVYRAATSYLMDVEVFQDAGWALRRGQDLYSENFPTRSGYRFIYPPFAALLFYPLTWLGPVTLQVTWTICTIAAIYAMLWMIFKRIRCEKPAIFAASILGLVLLLEPLNSNFRFGQINVFLALLVVADVLGFIPKKLRGIGVGVAAGIKITPAAYALLFLMRKDWLSVAKSFGWFLVTAIIGTVIRPQESLYFWTKEFFASNRGGQPSYEANQAMSGLLARAGLEGTALNIGIYGFFVLGAVAAAFMAWALQRDGHYVLALGVVALAVSFAGPYAVTHHWSIVMVFVPIIFISRNWFAIAIGFLTLLANWWAPYGVFTNTPGHIATSVGQWFYGNMQGVMGFVLLAVALCTIASNFRNPRRPRNEYPAPWAAVN